MCELPCLIPGQGMGAVYMHWFYFFSNPFMTSLTGFAGSYCTPAAYACLTCILWSNWTSRVWCGHSDCIWCLLQLLLSPGNHTWLWPVWCTHSPIVIGRHVLQYPSRLPQTTPSLKGQRCRSWLVLNIRLPWPHQMMCLPSHVVILPQTNTVRCGAWSAPSGERHKSRLHSWINQTD
jgi:hypothetical protein